MPQNEKTSKIHRSLKETGLAIIKEIRNNILVHRIYVLDEYLTYKHLNKAEEKLYELERVLVAMDNDSVV